MRRQIEKLGSEHPIAVSPYTGNFTTGRDRLSQGRAESHDTVHRDAATNPMQCRRLDFFNFVFVLLYRVSTEGVCAPREYGTRHLFQTSTSNITPRSYSISISDRMKNPYVSLRPQVPDVAIYGHESLIVRLLGLHRYVSIARSRLISHTQFRFRIISSHH